MKGLEVEEKVYKAILADPKWAQLLVFDGDGNVFVDLKKYSDLGHYLPINSEFQSYVVGFIFMKDLYDCKYRTQIDCVHIYVEQPKPKRKPEIVEVRKPVFKETELGVGDAAIDHCDHEFTTEYIAR